MNTESVPTTAEPKRQPNESFPNSRIDRAMASRPSGGWTVTVCSPGLARLH